MNGKTKLLVVDDEQIILDSVKKLLKKEENYDITTVLSVKNALQHLEDNTVDIILTDLMMPEIDGLEFLKILKEQDYRGIVIMLTGYATINSALQAMELGAFDYLAKPFTKEEIKKILSRANDVIAVQKTKKDMEGDKVEEKLPKQEQTTTGRNTWFMTKKNGLVLIGVERPFLFEIGSIESVYLPDEGDEIRQGSNFFQIFSSDLRSFSVTAPFTGIIVEVNKLVLDDPNGALKDPYDAGWLIKMKPQKFDEELASLSLKY